MSNKQQGFTLIEVMIVTVIIAILAAIAIPSYQSHIQKTRRTDAKSTLSQIAAAQERYFFTNNGYAVGTDFSKVYSSTSTPDGHYTIAALNACGDSNCYRVTATATGSQATDTACNQFSINHIGQQTATKHSSLGGGDNTSECW